MLINEGGLIRAIKRAYKAGGYTVLNTGNDVAIYTDHWFAMANRALLPRKVLATIVEHMGMIPERDMPTSIIKDTEPQLVLRETAAAWAQKPGFMPSLWLGASWGAGSTSRGTATITTRRSSGSSVSR